MLLGKLKRRRRHIAYISLISTLFIFILIIIFWFTSISKETYKPGEKLEGLTTSLSRDLPVNYPEVVFADVTSQAGIQFNHFQSARTTQLPEDMGSGASWGDYDQDGWDDLFIANFSGNIKTDPNDFLSAVTCQLYHNNGDGTFTEVSRKAGLAIKAYANSGSWVDIDNDGWPDLLLTTYGELRLFKNNRDGTFRDISAESGISGRKGFWSGAAAGDFNRDGFPDLYICGYVNYNKELAGKNSRQYEAEVPASLNPSSFTPVGNLLFENNGDGTFREMAGKADVENANGRSLSATWIDFDEDGWQDLYVANDVSDNALFHNLGSSKFENISYGAMVADYRGAMGITAGDWDNDEDMDLFITHWMAQENALYTNLLTEMRSAGDKLNGRLRFMDEADRYGLGQSALNDIGFGTAFMDYDNDGRLDLFVVNGSTFQEEGNPANLVAMKDKIYWNRGPEAGFYDVSPVSGPYFSKKYVGRGLAVSDYDQDGDPDVFITNNCGPGILLRNDGGNKKHWFEIEFAKSGNNRFQGGIRIRLVAGNDVQVRQTESQGSYLSQSSAVVHFGLNRHTRVDTLEIIWPEGNARQYLNLKSDVRFTVTREIEDPS